MTIKNKLTITTIAAFAGLGLLAGGGAAGYAIAQGTESSSVKPVAQQAPCNLRLVWDRVQQDYLAVYDDSDWISYTGDYGRTANLSCTDDQILAWQEQRRQNGLDPAVCRPVLHDDVTGTVHSVGCATPSLVVADESR